MVNDIVYDRFLRIDFILKKEHSDYYVTDERGNIDQKDA